MLLLYILGFSLLGSIGALTGAGVLLAFPALHVRLKAPLLAYAVGTLLGATFIGLLPAALEQGNVRSVLLMTLAGFVAFFLLEKVLRLPHVHAHASEHPDRHPAGTLILWGDAVHNFVDGVVIATSFFVSVPLGILTSLAIVAHELPQELGDFVILLESGWNRWRAYWANFVSALGTVAGAVCAILALDLIQPYLPFLLAVAAASFLYIAATDIAPILHHEVGIRTGIRQAFFLLLGIGTMASLHQLLG